MLKHFKLPLIALHFLSIWINMYKNFIKHIIEVFISLFTLLLLSPFLILIGIAIYIEDGNPVLFRQKRVGKNLKPYTLFKFRSMPNSTGDIASSEASSLKVTKIGGFIRRTNVDELPQLFNVILGDMSLVGPRPAIPSQEDLIKLRNEKGVYDCKPGLTGLAQINSYDGMPESEKVSWDSKYVSSISFLHDAVIILRTFSYLVKRPPVY